MGPLAGDGVGEAPATERRNTDSVAEPGTRGGFHVPE